MARKKQTMDGNNAAAWVSYPFTDVAAMDNTMAAHSALTSIKSLLLLIIK